MGCGCGGSKQVASPEEVAAQAQQRADEIRETWAQARERERESQQNATANAAA